MQATLSLLLVLQCILNVGHDCVDVPGWVYGSRVRATVGRTKFLIGTAVTAIFPVLAAAFAVYFWSRPKPGYVYTYWVWYCGITVVSAIGMWWIPYLFGAKPETQRMYSEMYRGTLQVMPKRGDNPRPNLFHLILHALFAITLVLSLLLRFGRK